MNRRTEVIILGQIVLDTIIHLKKISNQTRAQNINNQIPSLGGPPIYSGITTLRLSKFFKWIKTPFIYAYACNEVNNQLKNLKQFDLILKNLVIRSECPHFHLIYQNGELERELYLRNPPKQFNPADFNWNFSNPPIAITGSIYDEFNNLDIFRFLRKKCSYIAFDPQGNFREINSDNHIIYKKWNESEILSQINCLKISEVEACKMGIGSNLKQIAIELLNDPLGLVLITKGNKGCIMGVSDLDNKKKDLYHIPAYITQNVIDETGAGDAFLSAFIMHFQIYKDEITAAAFATSVASLLIEKVGYEGNFSRENIILRQNSIRTQIKKITNY